MAHHDTEGIGERSDMPIVCETCLGPNPYVRMQRVRCLMSCCVLQAVCNPTLHPQIEYGGQCHVSGRPYTVFRWKPGPNARYKKTIVCQEVAKAKNVCQVRILTTSHIWGCNIQPPAIAQVCLLDLAYNLPVQVRDQALGIDPENELPTSAVGREFALMEQQEAGTLGSQFIDAPPNELLQRLQRQTPYYEVRFVFWWLTTQCHHHARSQRNKARICTFFVKGQCTRGAECPYRHEKPKDGEDVWGLSQQNIKDRYYGVKDPVANKMLARAAEYSKPEPPADTSITTLWIGGLPDGTRPQTLQDMLYLYGEVTDIRIVEAKKCAFVTFGTREAAERAMDSMARSFVLEGQRCKVHWGKPKEQVVAGGGGVEGGASGSYYPAMDSQQMGTVAHDKRGGDGAAAVAPGPKRARPDA